jgi:2-keto-4-pentenoate hydratase
MQRKLGKRGGNASQGGYMVPLSVRAAAAELVALRRAGRIVPALAEGLEPVSVADGYNVQDAFRGLWPDKLAGWKIGATALEVQERFGIGEPFSGPFFEGDVYISPARPEAARFPHLCLESEFAFRFGHPILPRKSRYGRNEILEAIDCLLPAIEIIGPRFDSLLFGRAPMAIADCALNSGFVFGAPVMSWRDADLANHLVELRIDGQFAAQGTGAKVLGNPLTVLDWAVNHLNERRIAIDAGQIISTGTMTGLIHVKQGQEAVVDFGRFGTVEVTFTGPVHPQNVAGAA